MDASTTYPVRRGMTKEVQMSIKMEPDLRDRFMALAADRHRPAAQIIRDLMRLYIAESETPNALTAETLRKSRDGEDVLHASSASDLFKHLGI
jgi:predicted DNA-binding protein